jgi:hypothetical protein
MSSENAACEQKTLKTKEVVSVLGRCGANKKAPIARGQVVQTWVRVRKGRLNYFFFLGAAFFFAAAFLVAFFIELILLPSNFAI